MRNRASRPLRTVIFTLIAGLLLQGNAYASNSPSTAEKWAKGAAATFDLILLRPVGLAVIGVGMLALLPTALMTWPNGRDSLKEAENMLILKPTKDLFERPLGEF